MTALGECVIDLSQVPGASDRTMTSNAPGGFDELAGGRIDLAREAIHKERDALLHAKVRSIDYFAMPWRSPIPYGDGESLTASELRDLAGRAREVTPHEHRRDESTPLGPFARALGEYVIYFGQVDEAVLVLSNHVESASPEGRVYLQDWLQAEAKVDREKIPTGQLGAKVTDLILGTLDSDSVTQARARDVLLDLEPRVSRVIRERNALVHRELGSIDHLAATDGNGVRLVDGRMLTASNLRSRSVRARSVTFELRAFLWRFVRARKSVAGSR
ncbi:MAG: hypothetical protein F4Z08_03420 [Chloroflexi bacterium]|nr:hypothetical protein [Chloroflexota bacterium]